MGTARISSKGQVAIPAALRKAIDLRPGAEVTFELAGSAILLRPVPQFKPLTPKEGDGCIPHRGPNCFRSRYTPCSTCCGRSEMA